MGVVIVGAGQAGFQVAWSLRTEGYDGSIALIGEEPHLPYQRPPLSKGFLLGKQGLEHTTLRPEKFYQDQRIDLILGERVTSIRDRVTLGSGAEIAYDHLVLATGARPRRLPGDYLYLRGRDEAAELKDRLDRAGRIVVIGGGFIGLEVASAARTLGKDVTIMEITPRFLSRSASNIISDFFRDLHIREGVHVVFGPCEIPPADLIIAGIGVVPNVELALQAGLAVADGIAVSEYLRTSDPRIFAIGDCATHPLFGRLESVQNAVDQARCVAANIAGKEQRYSAVPWFWTDQFDAKLQMAGLSGGADLTVLRGAPPKFSIFYFRSGVLIAADSINRPADHIAARKLLASGAALTPEQAADESVALTSLIR